MQPRYDIVAIGESGAVLAVEARAKWGTDAEWASQWRRNIATHSALPSADFFLLALPDRFYLWNNNGTARRQVWLEPAFEVDPASLLEPYFERIGIEADRLQGETFEFILLTWLNDMIDASNSGIVLDASTQWLDLSGLYDALRNTHVVLTETA